ncbi:MAG: trehalose-6-phosphate synthase [Actinomycetales bacterium]|nr:trehalose-6-phosphate synthase [Actinomycetales bacterium]
MPQTPVPGPVTATSDPQDLIVVANRLPIEAVGEGPDMTWQRSPGGLVSALEPALQGARATWIGWSGHLSGSGEATPGLPEELDGLGIGEVPLTELDVHDYYEGLANGAIWPLYHDAVATPIYHRHEFERYVDVNRRFADVGAQSAPPNGVVWVHDYQLQLVPRLLREQRPDMRIGFFLHIPFPPVELFAQLPWRRQILEGLLGADLVGFQTVTSAQNFLSAVRRLLALRPGGDRVEVPETHGYRTVRVGSFPIGIDAKSFEALAMTPAVQARAREIRRELGDYPLIFLGVDRLDYTKGIDIRMRAFGEAVRDGILDADQVTMLQLAIPSRENVEEYRRIRDDVELVVGRVNGDLGRVGDPAIHYLRQAVSREELVAMYVAADALLVTPLRDGMNLVVKEYVACRTDNTGAVVLSEFTGAAQQLHDAFLVNPYDLDQLKRTLGAVATATPEELSERMEGLRTNVFEHDVDRWARSFLATLSGALT